LLLLLLLLLLPPPPPPPPDCCWCCSWERRGGFLAGDVGAKEGLVAAGSAAEGGSFLFDARFADVKFISCW
jgi:hypothetical protein